MEGNKSLAESLAFASILKDGTPIRLTGQDSERGTFAQRSIHIQSREPILQRAGCYAP
jgi:2-oxoglutarate dehydrogenase E1 component